MKTGKRKLIIISMHILGWSLLFIIPAFLLYLNSVYDSFLLIENYFSTFYFMVIFYVNYLVLAPLLFFRNRKFLYFLSAVALIVMMTVVFDQWHIYMFRSDEPPWERIEFRESPGFGPDEDSGHSHPPFKGDEFRPGGPRKEMHIYNFLITSVLISGFSLGLRFSQKMSENEKQRKETEKEKLKSELAFLKNQVSPHFFFNTLNNIYSLMQSRSEEAQKAILQLSKLMRYLLYETGTGNTFLSQEIEFMRNYIELMKLRISGRIELWVDFPDEFDDVSIPPLLFIPFVENAFKHGISYREPSFINIVLRVESGEIAFWCSNSMRSNDDESLGPDTGIGLENVKKRLGLLFPDQHKLIINQSGSIYSVNLIITLNNNEQYDTDPGY